MKPFIIEGSLCLLLLVNGWLDWRRREISLLSLGVFGAAGLGMNLWLRYQSLPEILGGAGLGLVLMAAAFLTLEAVGFGDGLLLCVTGIYLGFWENLRLLVSGLLMCSLTMAAGLALRRVRLKDRFPFVPFLMLAYIGRVLGCWVG